MYQAYGDGSRVAFFGDSITRLGGGILRVAAQYRALFPERDIRFFNVGISGGGLVAADRVHPADFGHWRLAGTLLEAQGLPVPAFKPQEEVIAESGLGEWFELSQRLANILSAEWHFVRDETIGTEAKLAKVHAWLDENRGNPSGNPYHPFLVRLANDYLRYKPEENILRSSLGIHRLTTNHLPLTTDHWPLTTYH